ncbi:MAG: hypothetical protein ACM3SS_09080 [Rhodospirillaceae bacterium]
MSDPKFGEVNSRFAACAAVAALALVGCAPDRREVQAETADSAAAQHMEVSPAPTAAQPVAPAPRPVRHADFGELRPGDDARRIADWVVDSGDNRNAPFVIIDKPAATAYAFDRNGKVIGAAPVLLGLAKGDDNPPHVGDKPLSAIPVEERITAAGRYVAELGYNLRGEDVLWVDYDSGLSLHRVLTKNRNERRLQRLATPTPLDNRISYGCINVPVSFFERVIRPAYRDTKGMVYVLPETRSAQAVFGAYDVEDRAVSDAQERERAAGYTKAATRGMLREAPATRLR